MIPNVNTMLDPSLFADSSYKSTFQMMSDLDNILDFTVSESFSDLLIQGNLIDDEPVRDYFSTHTSFYEHDDITELFRSKELSTFDAREHFEEYEMVYQLISEVVTPKTGYIRSYGDSTLVDILFDEFIFSITNSPILSRKQISQAFKQAASFTINISKNRLDAGWELINDQIDTRSDDLSNFISELIKNADERLDEEDPILLSTILRQIVKDYAPNWIIHVSDNYVAPSAGAAVGGLIGGSLGGPQGGAVGGVAGTTIGAGLQDFVVYVADP